MARFARNRASIWGTETLGIVAICRMTGVVPEKPSAHSCEGNRKAMNRGRDGMRCSSEHGGTSTGGTVAFGKEFRSMDFLAGIRNRVADQYVRTADYVLFLTRCELFLELVLLSRRFD